MGDRISAIILAAGLSSRMGRLKPLLPLGKMTILEHVILLFQDAGVEDVRVVTGHRHADIGPVTEARGATPVFNPDYEKDMFSSVVAGCASLAPDTEAVFILPVDIPLVQPSSVTGLLKAYTRNRGKIIRPVYESRQGHPPIIPACLFGSIANWVGPEGLRGALAQFASDTVRVEVPDENVVFDVDTPEDYEELQLKFQIHGCYP